MVFGGGFSCLPGQFLLLLLILSVPFPYGERRGALETALSQSAGFVHNWLTRLQQGLFGALLVLLPYPDSKTAHRLSRGRVSCLPLFPGVLLLWQGWKLLLKLTLHHFLDRANRDYVHREIRFPVCSQNILSSAFQISFCEDLFFVYSPANFEVTSLLIWDKQKDGMAPSFSYSPMMKCRTLTSQNQSGHCRYLRICSAASPPGLCPPNCSRLF